MRHAPSAPRVRLLLLSLLLALAAPLAAQAGLGGYHEDERVGFKVKFPRGWDRIPTLGDEKWLVGGYTSDKDTFFTDPNDGMTSTFKPKMTMIAFIDDVVKKRGPSAKKDGERAVVLVFNNPFKNYKDYLKRTYRGGGWYVSDEAEGDIRGVPVEMLEIKVEKLAYGGPKRLVAWIFDLEDVKVAIQFEVLENTYAKMKGDIYGALKSFKRIERTKALTPTTTGEDAGTLTRGDESKLKPAERAKRRASNEAILRRKATESVPDDWEVYDVGPFLVLNHADRKYAQKLCNHVEAVWKWLDANLGYIGEGEYVCAPIIRICKDADEENALHAASTTWGNRLEIVTHKDTSAGQGGWAWESVNRSMLRIWFSHRDPDLYVAAPHWLDYGLRQVLGTARAKGKKLEFAADQWELEALRKAARAKTLTSPKTFVMLGREGFSAERTRSQQAGAFVRFLLASKNKKARAFLKDYFLSLKEVITEIDAKEKAKDGKTEKAPETEEEEEERYQKRQSAWKEKEQELLQSTFDRAFGTWTEKDWKRLEKLYVKSVD